MSEWADQNRRLSEEASAEPGAWVTARAEYQRGIMDAFSDPIVEEVVVKSSSQVGKTEVLNNVAGYFIDQDPCPILIIQPTVEMGSEWSKARFAPMLRDTPCLQGKVGDPGSRESSNTILVKEFKGGRISITGANSPAGLSARPIRVVLFDEVDRFPASAGAEGDPVNLGRKRTQTYWNRKVGMFSTPTVKGASRIDDAYEETDKCSWHVPCPVCGGYQVLRWGQVKWSKNEKGKTVDVHYECEHCRAKLYEHDKLRMVRNGHWVAENPDVKKKRGFHINELYSPWSTWEMMVSSFYEAQKKQEMLKTWVNTCLGEVWEEEAERISDVALMEKRERYGPEIPTGAYVLTAGIDVQTNRLEVSIFGWGRNEEAWLIRHLVIQGDPQTDNAVWNSLEILLTSNFSHEEEGTLRIASACIDSGFATKRVYEFVRPREGRRVWATKGQDGMGRPILKINPRRNKHGVRLGYVGTDGAKELIYSRLKLSEFGPGYLHFPRECDEEYFRQLTAEQVKTKFVRGYSKRVWEKTRARNEALDCAVLALAAVQTLQLGDLVGFCDGIDAERKKEREKRKAAGKGGQEVRAKVKKRGFVHGY